MTIFVKNPSNIKYNIENHSIMINFFHYHQFVKLNAIILEYAEGWAKQGVNGISIERRFTKRNSLFFGDLVRDFPYFLLEN